MVRRHHPTKLKRAGAARRWLRCECAVEIPAVGLTQGPLKVDDGLDFARTPELPRCE